MKIDTVKELAKPYGYSEKNNVYDLYVDGVYTASTNFCKTGRQAIAVYSNMKGIGISHLSFTKKPKIKK